MESYIIALLRNVLNEQRPLHDSRQGEPVYPTGSNKVGEGKACDDGRMEEA